MMSGEDSIVIRIIVSRVIQQSLKQDDRWEIQEKDRSDVMILTILTINMYIALFFEITQSAVIVM